MLSNTSIVGVRGVVRRDKREWAVTTAAKGGSGVLLARLFVFKKTGHGEKKNTWSNTTFAGEEEV